MWDEPYLGWSGILKKLENHYFLIRVVGAGGNLHHPPVWLVFESNYIIIINWHLLLWNTVILEILRFISLFMSSLFCNWNSSLYLLTEWAKRFGKILNLFFRRMSGCPNVGMSVCQFRCRGHSFRAIWMKLGIRIPWFLTQILSRFFW